MVLHSAQRLLSPLKEVVPEIGMLNMVKKYLQRMMEHHEPGTVQAGGDPQSLGLQSHQTKRNGKRKSRDKSEVVEGSKNSDSCTFWNTVTTRAMPMGRTTSRFPVATLFHEYKDTEPEGRRKRERK